MLPIYTNQDLGIAVPLGLVVTQMRTSADQVLVFDEDQNMAYLQHRLDLASSSTPESYLETSLVQRVMTDGFDASE